MADNVTRIKEQLGVFLDKETELAKAELVPAAKKAGIGSGMFVVALAFVLHAVWMFVIALAALLAWLISLTGLSTALSIVLGFLAAMLISLIFAAVFAALGWGNFKKVKAPKATIAEFKATVGAITDGWARREDPSMPIKSPDLGIVRDRTA